VSKYSEPSAKAKILKFLAVLALLPVLVACDPGANERAENYRIAAQANAAAEKARKDRAIAEQMGAEARQRTEEAKAQAEASKAETARVWKEISSEWGVTVTFIAILTIVSGIALAIFKVRSNHALERSRYANNLGLEVAGVAGRLVESGKLSIQEYGKLMSQVMSHERDAGSLAFAQKRINQNGRDV